MSGGSNVLKTAVSPITAVTGGIGDLLGGSNDLLKGGLLGLLGGPMMALPAALIGSGAMGGSSSKGGAASAIPSQLPTLGGGTTGQVIPGIDTPKFYNPNSFAQTPAQGRFNNAASALAGPMYMPTPMMPSTMPMHKIGKTIPPSLMAALSGSGGSGQIQPYFGRARAV